MFTGIVEEVGTVKSVLRKTNGKEITIQCSVVTGDTKNGDSISINGACQTVILKQEGLFTVFASDVTLSLTNLDNLKSGDSVNLERALTPSTRMGGHIVQGHVDFKGRVLKINRDSDGIEFKIDIPAEFSKYIVNKGSVTVDGISLTVVEKSDVGFKLYIIPETILTTTIGKWEVNSIVNVEVDILGKYIESLLKNDTDENRDSLFYGKLMENGFI